MLIQDPDLHSNESYANPHQSFVEEGHHVSRYRYLLIIFLLFLRMVCDDIDHALKVEGLEPLYGFR